MGAATEVPEPRGQIAETFTMSYMREGALLQSWVQRVWIGFRFSPYEDMLVPHGASNVASRIVWTPNSESYWRFNFAADRIGSVLFATNFAWIPAQKACKKSSSSSHI